MGTPTVTCCVCREAVSKRSTLCIGPQGRACRKHDETVAAIQEQHQQEIALKQEARLNESIQVIMTVEAVRCLHAVRGVPIPILLDNLRPKLKPHVFSQVKADVLTKPTLTQSELAAALLTWTSLRPK